MTPTDLVYPANEISIFSYRELPAISAVYEIWGASECFYVGRSRNLRRRWEGHHVGIPAIQAGATVIRWTPIAVEDLPTAEREAIERLNPVVNRESKKRPRKFQGGKMPSILLRKFPADLWSILHKEAIDAGMGFADYCVSALKSRDVIAAAALGTPPKPAKAKTPRRRRLVAVPAGEPAEQTTEPLVPGPLTIAGNWEAIREAKPEKTPGTIGKKCSHGYMNWLLCPDCNPR